MDVQQSRPRTQQEGADSKAEDDIKANGQDYANTYADIIPSVWYNDQICDEFIRTIARLANQARKVLYMNYQLELSYPISPR